MVRMPTGPRLTSRMDRLEADLREHERALMGFRTWETYGTSDQFGAEWARPGKGNMGELRESPLNLRTRRK